jgi:hypothetical protein
VLVRACDRVKLNKRRKIKGEQEKKGKEEAK